MFTLQNKTCLVTGAGSGIGAAIAETFARAQAFVYVTDRDEKSGHLTVSRIHEAQRPGRISFARRCERKERVATSSKRKSNPKTGSSTSLSTMQGSAMSGPILQTTGADLDRLFTT